VWTELEDKNSGRTYYYNKVLDPVYEATRSKGINRQSIMTHLSHLCLYSHTYYSIIYLSHLCLYSRTY